MGRALTSRRVAIALGALLQVGPAFAQSSAEARRELESVALLLESAAGRVSRATRPLAHGPRGYELPTYGAFFVLQPRALPAPRPALRAESEGASALAEAARRLEAGLQRVASAEVRGQIQENIRTLRRAEAEMRQREELPPPRTATSPELVPPSVRSDAVSIEKELEQLEHQVQAQLAVRIRLPRAAESGLQQELESQMRALHDQVEAFRQEAEKARAEAEKEVLERLGAAQPQAANAASQDETPLLPRMPLPLWPYRIESEDRSDRRSGEEVIRDVLASVTVALETEGWRLRQLRPEDVIVVAVDFVGRQRRGAAGAADRTLLVRVKKKILDDRHSGKIGSEEFRRAAEVVEY
jgi:Skp family chaperone for outer membrane proteins